MRRPLLAALAVAALAACASAPAPSAPSPVTTSAGTWTYAFDAGPGIASAILSGPDGRPQLRIICQAPTGDLMVTDWTFSRLRQGDVALEVESQAPHRQVGVGEHAVDGDGSRRRRPGRRIQFASGYGGAASKIGL